MLKISKSLFVGLWLLQSIAYGQLDTINYSVQTMTAISSQQYLPLWIVSNRFGVLEDTHNTLLRVGGASNYTFNKKWNVSFGLDVVANLHDIILQQGYVKLKMGPVELKGGRIEETVGTHEPSLSSGSLAQSRNARPIPKIGIGFPEYVNVPYTKGYLKIKGYFGHGWLEKDRAVSSPFLHEKNFYVKAGGSLPVNVYFGFAHFVVWSGIHSQKGKALSSIKDYWRIVTGQNADESTNNSQNFPGEVHNGLGNHLGIYDAGVNLNSKKYGVSIYHQTFFEDKSGVKLFMNRDRLIGISIKSKEKKKVFGEILYEYLNTTYQSGPNLHNVTGGRDDYYNNYFYRSGWTYFGRVIGNPLLTTSQRTKYYFPDLNEYNMVIANNRVEAYHLGFKGALSNCIDYSILATYTRNFGTYTGINMGPVSWASLDRTLNTDYAFYTPRQQYYFLLECNMQLYKGLDLQTAFGVDTGGMTYNLGGLLGLTWNLTTNSK